MARKNKTVALVEAKLHRLESEKQQALSTLGSINAAITELDSILNELVTFRKSKPVTKAKVKLVKAPTPAEVLRAVEAEKGDQ